MGGVPLAGLHIEVRGRVQGVGFRPWVYTLATEAGLRGRVWNHAEGVSIVVFGEAGALRQFADRLWRPPAPAALVTDVLCAPIPFADADGFAVVGSRAGGPRSLSIPPDWATCDTCRSELRDPGDRRHRYAFINCTHCGPRYTICRDVPYDRARTTMASFPLCPRCRGEYEDPRHRRFHAEPNACPECGPRLALNDAHGAALDGDPLHRAARLLREGRIVAVKGLGGYHLACDATSAEVVAELRRRKRRDEKPFAVMVPDLDRAAAIAVIGAAERELLSSGERPIVLVRRRNAAGTTLTPAGEVAPGNPWLGLMLPYTALHEMLLEEARRPLVMTSANLSDEPMVCADDEARRRLRDVADFLLVHDRDIANRCDDSVARVIAGVPVVLRRGRGHVPASLRLPRPVPRPVLACGAHLKNAFCLAEGDLAWLGPHIGDLETDEACRDFEESVERFARFVGIAPQALAHDLHPDYFSTRYALERDDLPSVAVQHHHAHVASCMAEHGLEGPVIALAWDGTGRGTDGAAWGGEALVATFDGFDRVATFRPIPLAGGDRAIRHVWRCALALLDDAFEGAPPLDRLRLFDHVDRTEIAQVRRMIASGLNSPRAHGVGRFFDAFGALVLARTEARYEGQVAVELSGVADEGQATSYEYGLEPGPERMEVDLRATLREAVRDILDGAGASAISARFHATLVAAAVEVVHRAAARAGRLPVVLSGGCFQNALLVEGLRRALPAFEVFTHRRVPPGDGGIALGQVAVAAALLGGSQQ